MKFSKIFFILVLGLAMTLAACSPAGTEPEVPETGGTEQAGTGEELPPEVAGLAQSQLAEQLGVAAEDINIESFERAEWPNACLGVEGVGEACAQVITPGWRVILTVDGQQYEVHTDELGQAARIVGESLPLEGLTPTP